MSADKRDGDEGFLARWSRLKRTDDRQETGKANAGDAAATAEPRDDPPAFDPATLPRIEDLTGVSDISAFLRQGVPEELRRLALRKAWALDPKIRDFVEVAENQYDFNKPDGVPGFGPLAADVDLKALLAQAIGEVPAKAKAHPEVEDAGLATVDPIEDQPAPGASAPPADQVPEQSADAHRMTLPASRSAVIAAGVDPEHADTVYSPRLPKRHGGALPGAKRMSGAA